MSHYFRAGRVGEKKLISLSYGGYVFEFITYSSLFSGEKVDQGTMLLLENLDIPSEGYVLDMGCGYGVIGIVLAKLNPKLRVYMVDVNPYAVKIARYNAKINKVEKNVIVLQGDRYKPVENIVFQAIYSNPPLSAGMKIVEDIVLEAKKHLDENGHAQFVLARGGEYLAQKAKQTYRIVKTMSKKGYILLYLKP